LEDSRVASSQKVDVQIDAFSQQCDAVLVASEKRMAAWQDAKHQDKCDQSETSIANVDTKHSSGCP